jgi:hypothetical protein
MNESDSTRAGFVHFSQSCHPRSFPRLKCFPLLSPGDLVGEFLERLVVVPSPRGSRATRVAVTGPVGLPRIAGQASCGKPDQDGRRHQGRPQLHRRHRRQQSRPPPRRRHHRPRPRPRARNSRYRRRCRTPRAGQPPTSAGLPVSTGLALLQGCPRRRRHPAARPHLPTPLNGGRSGWPLRPISPRESAVGRHNGDGPQPIPRRGRHGIGGGPHVGEVSRTGRPMRP